MARNIRPAAHRAVDAAVAGIFQREGGVRVHDPDQKVQQVLAARTQHDLLRFAPDAAVLPQKVGQRPPKLRVALRVAESQKLRHRLHDFPVDPGPGGVWERGGVHVAGGEVKKPREGRGLRLGGRRAGHFRAARQHGGFHALRLLCAGSCVSAARKL
jgi:hypothetical protein